MLARGSSAGWITSTSLTRTRCPQTYETASGTCPSCHTDTETKTRSITSEMHPGVLHLLNLLGLALRLYNQ